MKMQDVLNKLEETNDQVNHLHDEVVTLNDAINEINALGVIEDVKMAELYLIITSIRETVEVMKDGR